MRFISQTKVWGFLARVHVKEITKATKEDLYEYDLVCIGSPVFHSLPPPDVFEYIKESKKNIEKNLKLIYQHLS